MQLKRSSMPHDLASNSTTQGLLGENIDWWRIVDSSIINEKPGTDEPEEYRHGNYVPQHTVAKKHITEDADASGLEHSPANDDLARDSVNSTQIIH